VGGGHLSAARALAAELESTGQATTRLVDAYLDCGRFPVTRFPAAYAWLARSHPRLWAALYHGSNTRLDPKLVLGPFLRSGFGKLLAVERPDLVISVLPVVNGLLAEVTRPVGARLEVVLTDWHSVHRFWVAQGVDFYTAPTESAREDCIRFGAPEQAVDVVGIPVRRAFATSVDGLVRTRVLSELGLDSARFTILAMVGAEGSPRAVRNIEHLAQLDLHAQLVVVCGRNAALRQHVQQLPARMPLLAVGFVDNVAELMRAADVLVTKAGGLTLAEAFCSRVPVVVHDILPGQEAGNLEYVLHHDAVRFAPDPSTLGYVVRELFGDSAKRTALAERGARLARPDAAQRIARDVLTRMNA
jgi:UDP-N-acetylglucosamine:LPS N-acetylglucosamine transferase